MIDNRSGRLQAERDRDFFVRICRRRLSVGADGVILLETSNQADFRYVHINADGSIAEMCGNGSRAIVYFSAQLGIVHDQASFEINDHIYRAVINGRSVTTEFIPPSRYDLNLSILEEPGLLAGGFIDTGVPHFVIFVPDVLQVEVDRLGRKYRWHSFFPSGTNVDFVQIVGQRGENLTHRQRRRGALVAETPQEDQSKAHPGDQSHLRVRTFERGVEAETLACGTGAVASAIIAHLRYGLRSPVRITFAGGDLIVAFNADFSHLTLSGDVTPIYQGQLIGDAP